ncbi:MAG: carboxypeptidase-like regulatory domain-containing protein, partial [Bacteroidetes bacterium]|nr:carboxypeptidase-like regulatory domain-containing protein [Candidatus Cryptobacteroides avicola]
MTAISLSASLFAREQEDERITLELDNVTLETAIATIEEQSSYLFMNSEVDIDQTISLSVENETIGNVCKSLFTPINVNYRIEGHHIYISNAPEPEPVSISGVIVDQTGLPVPGAAVLESGTSNGTTTGLDGSFTLTVSDPAASIEVNCLGYNTVTLPVGSRTVFNLTLEEEAVALEGTVVTALG